MKGYAMITNPFIGMQVEYRPRVTGGVVLGTVTAIREVPGFPEITSATVMVTDGTAVWPAGQVEQFELGVLHEPTA
jgi:hypothetical protein